MAKDGMGNELTEGDLVQLTLSSNVVYGRIVEIEDGGLGITRTSNRNAPREVKLGVVRVLLAVGASFHPPGYNLGNEEVAAGLVKMIQPDPQRDMPAEEKQLEENLRRACSAYRRTN